MKKTVILILVVASGKMISQVQRQQQQPLIQQNFSRGNVLNNNDNNIKIQVQNFNPIFATNVSLNNSNKAETVKKNPVSVRANPVAVSTNKSNIKAVVVNTVKKTTTQHRRIRTTNIVNTQPLPQINFINVQFNANPPVQGNFDNQINVLNNVDININDILENNSPQVQAAVPQVQSGGGGNSFSLNINLPKLNLPSFNFKPIKFSGGSSHSYHKKFHFKNKWIKLNRKMGGKFSFGRKLRIKVDNCFRW